MKALTLTQVLKAYKSKIKGKQGVLIQDTDGDFAFLYESQNRIALQFQDDWCPIVYPLMRYKVVGVVSVFEALQRMKQRTLERAA